MTAGREAFSVHLTRVAQIPLHGGDRMFVMDFVLSWCTCNACPGPAISSPAPRIGDGARQAISCTLYETDSAFATLYSAYAPSKTANLTIFRSSQNAAPVRENPGCGAPTAKQVRFAKNLLRFEECELRGREARSLNSWGGRGLSSQWRVVIWRCVPDSSTFSQSFMCGRTYLNLTPGAVDRIGRALDG